MQGTNGCRDIESVVAVDINGNYYSIRKVLMGREGGPRHLQISKLVQNSLKTILQ
jgi:hypothetical protein